MKILLLLDKHLAPVGDIDALRQLNTDAAAAEVINVISTIGLVCFIGFLNGSPGLAYADGLPSLFHGLHLNAVLAIEVLGSLQGGKADVGILRLACGIHRQRVPGQQYWYSA